MATRSLLRPWWPLRQAVTRPVALLPANTRAPSGVTLTASGWAGAANERTLAPRPRLSSVTVLEPMSPVQIVCPSPVTPSMCEPAAPVASVSTIRPSARRTTTTAPAVSEVTASRLSPGKKAIPWGRGNPSSGNVRVRLRVATSRTVRVEPPAPPPP
jgi:hypothetical protein